MNKAGNGSDPIYKLAQQRVNKLVTKIEAESQVVTAAGSDVLVLAQPDSLSPQRVHSLRVCAKRLQALLQLYRPVVGKAAIRPVEQAIKALAASYSCQREAVVQFETLMHLVEQYRQSEDTDIQPLVAYLEKHLQALAATSAPMDPLLTLSEIMRMWQEKLACRKAPPFGEGLDFAYRRARKLAYQAESSDDDDIYHRCRKWAKYYLYQLQMLVPDPRPKDKPQIKQLKRLGESLGAFHDRCVLEYSINQLLQQKPLDEKLEQAALLMLSWLMEQKRKDKARCQELCESVFARPHNPVKLKC